MQLSRLLRLLPLVAPLLVTTVAKAQSADPPVTGKGLVGGALLGGEVVLLTEAAIKVKPAWAYYVGAGVGIIGGGIGGHYLESSLSSKEGMYMLSAGILLVIPATVAALNAASYDTPLEYTQDTPPSDQPSDDALSSEGAAQSSLGSDMPTMPAVNSQNAPPPVPGPTPNPPPAAPATPPPAAAPPAPSPASAPPANTNPTSSPTPAQPQGSRLQHGSRSVAHWRAAPVILPPALLDISGKELAVTVPAVEIRDTYTRREVAMYGVKQQTEVRVPLFQMIF